MFLVFLLLAAVVASNATAVDVEVRLNEATALRDCDVKICRAQCKRNDLPDGKCINGKCMCPISIESNVHACNYAACQNYCRHKGFVVAKCYNDECFCYAG